MEYKCKTCNRKIGEYHEKGCDREICPECGDIVIRCNCEWQGIVRTENSNIYTHLIRERGGMKKLVRRIPIEEDR